MCVKLYNRFEIETNCIDLEKVGAKWLKTTKSRTKKSLCNYLRLRGFAAKVPKNELQSDDVRVMDGVSNSQLTRLMYQLQGRTMSFPPRAGVFGQCFHENILEPKHFNIDDYNLRKSELSAINNMMFAVIQNQFAFDLIDKSEKEVVRTWIDKKTGLRCKGKLDLIINKANIGDLKTTSAMSLRQFESDLVKYDYDRQAAFYLSGVKGAKRFWFIGVQKRKPYRVFVVSYYCNSKFMRKGKRKFEFLMGKYKGVNCK